MNIKFPRKLTSQALPDQYTYIQGDYDQRMEGSNPTAMQERIFDEQTLEHGIGDTEFWRDIQRIQEEMGLARQR